MMSETAEHSREKWLKFNSLGLLIIFTASTFACLATYQWEQFYGFWYVMLGVSLITCYICFGIKNSKKEVKLLAAFSIWLVISRILNGDLFLAQDGKEVLNITLSCMFVTACMILPQDRRMKLLDVFAIITSVFCIAGAVMGIYTALTGKLYVNPLTEWYLCSMAGERLEIFGANSNVSGNWMFAGIFFLVYLFFRHKNPVFRVAAVLAALTEYAALAMTASRSNMMGFSVCIAMLVALLLFKCFKIKKTGYKILALVLAVVIAGPLSYISFSGTRHIMGIAMSNYAEENGVGDAYTHESAARPAYVPETLASRVMLSAESVQSDEAGREDVFRDNRGFDDSGRLPIYKMGIYSLKDEPMRLLRGCMSENIMSTTRPYLQRDQGHMHNSYIQVLHFAGIPGLLIVLAFTVLLFIHAVKLFFSESIKADMAVKSLVLFLPGLFIYNMLETSMFAFLDFRSIVLFLIAGAVIAYSYELCPPRVKKHK